MSRIARLLETAAAGRPVSGPQPWHHPSTVGAHLRGRAADEGPPPGSPVTALSARCCGHTPDTLGAAWNGPMFAIFKGRWQFTARCHTNETEGVTGERLSDRLVSSHFVSLALTQCGHWDWKNTRCEMLSSFPENGCVHLLPELVKSSVSAFMSPQWDACIAAWTKNWRAKINT